MKTTSKIKITQSSDPHDTLFVPKLIGLTVSVSSEDFQKDGSVILRDFCGGLQLQKDEYEMVK